MYKQYADSYCLVILDPYTCKFCQSLHTKMYVSNIIGSCYKDALWYVNVCQSCDMFCYKHNFYINSCPMRCSTKQSIYYSASSIYMFRVSTTPKIMSTQNCNYSLQYWSHSTGGCCYSFVYSWWWVWLTPKTCRVNSQNNKQTTLCCISLDN